MTKENHWITNKNLNFWCWWVHRPTEQEMEHGFKLNDITYKINELYLDIYGLYNKPKDDKEIQDYITLCKENSVKIYLVINGFASSDYIGFTKEQVFIKAEALMKKFTDMGANLVLDYVRPNGYTGIKATRKDILEFIDLAKSYDPCVKFAIFNWWKSKFQNQWYSDIYPKITIMPMIYGTDWTTRFWIWFHKTLFPKSEPCIRAWDTTKEEFLKQASMLQNFSVWKYPDWKELFK